MTLLASSNDIGPDVYPGNEFWEEMMLGIDRPSARGMLPLINPKYPLGVDPTIKGVSESKDSLFEFYKKVRRQASAAATGISV